MKWRKLLLFLAVSSAALACFAPRWPVFTIFEHLPELGQHIAPLRLAQWTELRPLLGALASPTGWAVCAALIIDILYLVWFRRQRHLRIDQNANSDLSAVRHTLSAQEYAERLRQRHVALLARYQDPGLVQFLLNREAARAQRIERWIEVAEPAEPMATVAATTKQNRHASGEQRSVDRTALRIAVNPLGA